MPYHTTIHLLVVPTAVILEVLILDMLSLDSEALKFTKYMLCTAKILGLGVIIKKESILLCGF
mgnify:CR=1 FL=1